MRARMTMQLDGVAESQAEYPAVVDYEHEHRFAEHDGNPELFCVSWTLSFTYVL